MATLEGTKLSGIGSISNTSGTSLAIGSYNSLLRYNNLDFIVPNTSTVNEYNVVKPLVSYSDAGIAINRGASWDDSIRIVNRQLSLSSGDNGRTFDITIDGFADTDMLYCMVQPISIVCESGGSSDVTYHNRIKYVGVTKATSSSITCQFKAWFSEATTVDVTFLAIVTKQKAYEHTNTYYIKSYYVSSTAAYDVFQYTLQLNSTPTDTVYLAYRFANTFDELKDKKFSFITMNSMTTSINSSHAWFQYYITSADRMTTYSRGVRTLALTSSSAINRTPDCAPVVKVTSSTNTRGSFTITVTNPGPSAATLYMELDGVDPKDNTPYTDAFNNVTINSGSTYTYNRNAKDWLDSDVYCMVMLTSNTTSDKYQYNFRIGNIVTPS